MNDGKVLPAWLLRHALQDRRLKEGHKCIAAYARVCADKTKSVFEIVCRPRVLTGAQGDKARFMNGSVVHIRFSFQAYTRGSPRNPEQELLAEFGELAE